ncbi:MAG TPA: flagellar hook-basal body complex protein, partial [Hyphomicrobiales bacterium]|nr:flagellar hook-basal body complex protein [Hyphomicrobiales bacterium]
MRGRHAVAAILAGRRGRFLPIGHFATPDEAKILLFSIVFDWHADCEKSASCSAGPASSAAGQCLRRHVSVMGIYGAMATAMSGMRAQSFALEQVSGNIANSQTTGFKRTESSFVDLIPEALPTRQIAGGVQAYSHATNDVQGDIQTSDSTTYIAINGDGYFVVAETVGQVDG